MCWWFIGDNVTESNKHIYFSTGTGSFDINDLVQKMAIAERQRILFIHSITGCDTVSKFYGHGKVQVYKKLTAKNSVLDDIFDVLLCIGQNRGDLVDHGIELMQYIYGDTCLRQ